MAMHAHLAMIQEKHSKLENIINEESIRPQPDFNLIQTLKKQKLLLKEELLRLQLLVSQRFDAA